MTPEEALLAAQPSWLKDGLGLFPDPYVNPFGAGEPARVIRTEAPPFDPPGFPEAKGGPTPPMNYTVCGATQSTPPTQDQLLALVSTVFSATSGTDYGIGTPRPLKMLASNFFSTISELAGDALNQILTAHSFNFTATPSCTLARTASAGSAPSVGRTGCFSASSTASGSDGEGGVTSGCGASETDPTCPSDCTNTSSDGVSASINESIDFGDVAIMEGDWASVDPATSYVWVSYSFGVLAEWECSTSECQNDQGGLCADEDGNPCGPAGTTSSGPVCTGFLGVADPGSPPPGATVVIPVPYADSGSLAIFFCDPTTLTTCVQVCNVTY